LGFLKLTNLFLELSIFENYLFAMSRVFLKNLEKKGRVE